MPHAFGYRARTRDLFAKGFRQKGLPPISVNMANYKVGDIVDVIGNGAIQQGLPHKFYHGKTGRVFNVAPHSLGVIINKPVRQRFIAKRIHVRVEHVRKSKSREAFLERIRENDRLKAEANKQKQRISTKRKPAAPEGEHVIEKPDVEYMNVQRFREIY